MAVLVRFEVASLPGRPLSTHTVPAVVRSKEDVNINIENREIPNVVNKKAGTPINAFVSPQSSQTSSPTVTFSLAILPLLLACYLHLLTYPASPCLESPSFHIRHNRLPTLTSLEQGVECVSDRLTPGIHTRPQRSHLGSSATS